jgi:hypothetical protein
MINQVTGNMAFPKAKKPEWIPHDEALL